VPGDVGVLSPPHYVVQKVVVDVDEYGEHEQEHLAAENRSVIADE
jgi:hypothetical protein